MKIAKIRTIMTNSFVFDLNLFSKLYLVFAVIIFIMGVLMYVKTWKMASNIERLTKHFCEVTPKEAPKSEIYSPEKAQNRNEPYDKRLDSLVVGDKVKRIYDNATMTIVEIGNGEFRCKAGTLESARFYPKSAFSPTE